jgi:hypothetical protein
MSTPKPGPPKPPTADPKKPTSGATTPEDPNKDGGTPMPLDEPKG